MHHKAEQTLVIVKPDGVQRGLIGEIISRYERAGLKLVGLKMLVPTPDFIERHYSLDPEQGMKTGTKTIESYRTKGKQPPSEDPLAVWAKVLENLKRYLSSGPVIAMVWRGIHAVGIVRKLTGGTEPLTSDVGTIRGDYTIDSYEISDVDNRPVRNLIHTSGSIAEANREVALWFKPGEVRNYRLIHEAILYDVNLDGILE